MTYVDGFVAAVPTANREKFKKHAKDAAVVFKEHGALKLVECWGDDVPDGEVTSSPWPSNARMMRRSFSRGLPGLLAKFVMKG
jgi:uncharacterized protein YbaA (DUF1428 family)